MAKDSALSADTLQKVEDLLNYEQKLVEKPPEEEEKVPEKDPNYVKILKHFGEHVGTELWLDYYGDLEKIKIQHMYEWDEKGNVNGKVKSSSIVIKDAKDLELARFDG